MSDKITIRYFKTTSGEIRAELYTNDHFFDLAIDETEELAKERVIEKYKDSKNHAYKEELITT